MVTNFLHKNSIKSIMVTNQFLTFFLQKLFAIFQKWTKIKCPNFNPKDFCYKEILLKIKRVHKIKI
jgi:hypothetical protein